MRSRLRTLAGSAAVALGGLLAWATLAQAEDDPSAADRPEAREASDEPRDDDCAALSMIDPDLVALSDERVAERIGAASPLTPSMVASHLDGIDGALRAYREDLRPCMRKAMMIHTMVSLESLTGPAGRLWYYGHAGAELKARFVEAPLVTPLSTAQRRDVASFVEERVLPALQSDGEEDREHWRRMYYGLLLACHAEESVLQELGGRRETQGCIDVTAITEAAESLRRAGQTVDPWASSPP